MPNHCYNRLSVTEGKDLILDILKGKRAFTDHECNITFNKLIPMENDINNPIYQNGKEHHLETICENSNFDWYNWSIDHWGTKWDAYDTEIKYKKTCVVFLFTTAWSPPIPVLQKIIEKFGNKVSFKYSYIIEGNLGKGTFHYTSKRNDFVNL